MKKTQIVELFKNIKRTLVSFLSIMMFVFLGVGLFSSLDFTQRSMGLSVDEAFERTNSYDIVIPFTFGITQEQANSFLDIEGVDEVEASNTYYEHFKIGDNNFSASLQTITNKVNKLDLREGKLPEHSNEMVVIEGCANSLGLKIGDKVSFNNGSGVAFSVINFVSHLDEVDLSTYTPENLNNLVNDEMEIVGIVHHPLYLSNSKSAYGTNAIDFSQVEAAFFANEDAFNPYVTVNTYNTLAIKSSELTKYKVKSEEYIDGVDKLAEKVTPLANSLTTSYKENFFNKFDYLNDNLGYVQDVVDAINSLGINVDNRVNDAMSYLESLEKLGNGLKGINEAYLNKRSANIVVTFSGLIVDIIKKLKYVLGGVFLLISFAICYSLINRLVHDDRVLIGTKKALGFTKKEIYFNYLGYIFIAVLLGTLLAIPITLPIENALLGSIVTAYNFPMHLSFFSPLTVLILFAITLIITNIFAILGCSNVLKEPARDLLQGEKAPSTKTRFYQRGKLWDNLGLLNKTIVNNTVNDKRRVIATIIGISASVCLVAGSITMRDNINNAFDKQFNEYFKFDSFVFYDNNVSTAPAELKSYFDSKEINSTPVYRQAFQFNIDNQKDNAGFIIVYNDTESFKKLVSIDPGLETSEAKYEGTWFPESYASAYDCKPGVDVHMSAVSGETGTTKITGFYKYYEYVCLIVMDSSTYKQTFGVDVVPNALIVNKKDYDEASIVKDLNNIEGFNSFFDYKSYLKLDLNVFESLSLILSGLYIVVDIFMSIFVVLELLLTFIKEKKRELITMMINGYSKHDACKYIYCDTIFLTIVSLLVGCLLGSLLGNLLVMTFESEYLFLLHGVSLMACGIGVLVTVALVAIMSIISLKKIRNFKLTDINK